jgi:hypothetical protein
VAFCSRTDVCSVDRKKPANKGRKNAKEVAQKAQNSLHFSFCRCCTEVSFLSARKVRRQG